MLLLLLLLRCDDESNDVVAACYCVCLRLSPRTLPLSATKHLLPLLPPSPLLAHLEAPLEGLLPVEERIFPLLRWHGPTKRRARSMVYPRTQLSLIRCVCMCVCAALPLLWVVVCVCVCIPPSCCCRCLILCGGFFPLPQFFWYFWSVCCSSSMPVGACVFFSLHEAPLLSPHDVSAGIY